MRPLKNFFKRIFQVTPFKLSVSIMLVFLVISVIYDIKPRLNPLILAIGEKSIDYKFSLRGWQKPKAKIVIVAGDEKSFQRFGQWPFDRGTVFAPLLETICKFGPKAVGLDIVWSEKEKLMPGAAKAAVSDLLGPKSAMLDNVLTENSGDGLMRKATELCGNKLVMGYALSSEGMPEEGKAEYEKRIKQLTSQGNNVFTTISRGKIAYPKYIDDSEANVAFPFIAHSGLLNLGTITGSSKIAQGFFNNERDSDGNYRHAQFFFKLDNAFVPSLTLRMAQKFLSSTDSPPMLTITPDSPEQGLTQELHLDLQTVEGSRRVPMDLYGQAIVNYRGPNNTYPNVSMADVLSPSQTIEYDLIDSTGQSKHYQIHKSEFFKDALVLVGITAQGLYDIRPRPFDPQASGVENHASILDNLVSDDFLMRPPTEMVLWFLLAIVVASLSYGALLARFGARLGALVGIGTIGGLLYFDQVYLFNNRGIVFSGHLQAIQFLFQYLGVTVLKYMREENEKKFIRSAFDKYVSPAVIDQVLKEPSKLRLGGDKRELSILFSDIRGFTELSERVDVKALTQFLNTYLGAMTDILQGNGGTLDKYIGDAVMGFWGAPLDLKNHARFAVKTAVEMVTKLDELNTEFKLKYGFTIDIGIGINTGAVSVGNFGSSKVFEYTVIGDNVNLASRLESINKYYGTHIIISETTYAELPPSEFLCREVDTVKVKGKKKPVKIYEVFPDNAVHAPLKNALSDFNQGLSHYYSKQWEKALAFFQSVLKLRDADRPSLELIERCRHYINNPPEADWDGSWEMHSK